jgi:hypothetical protein
MITWPLTATLMFGAGLHAQGRQDAERQIKRRPGQPLEQLVRPSERTLTVLDGSDPPLLVHPEPGKSVLTWYSEISDAVVLAEIEAKSSTLTAAGDWITSRVNALVVDVVKAPLSSSSLLASGSHFSFVEQGGQITLGGVSVTALVPSVRLLEVGKRYLLFLKKNPETGEIVVGPESTYELSAAGHFRRISSRAIVPRNDDIENLEQNEALIRIREAVIRSR